MTDIGNVLWEAAVIMLTGMMVVFCFLTVLIFLVQLLAKFAPQDPEQASSTQPISAVPNQNGIQLEVIAAISTAIQQYRQRKA